MNANNWYYTQADKTFGPFHSPPNLWYRMRKFGRRHRLALGVVTAMSALLLAWGQAQWQSDASQEKVLSLTERLRRLEAALSRLAETEQQLIRTGDRLSAESARELALALLETELKLPSGMLARDLPGFAQFLYQRSGSNLLTRAQAAFALGKLQESEALFLKSAQQDETVFDATLESPLASVPNWAAQADVIASSPPVVALPLATTEFLSLDELFEGTDYADYNSYSKKGILAKAQEKLKIAGVYLGIVDGGTGPKIQASINTWQRSRGLHVTGRLDAETQASLAMGHMEEKFPPARPQKTVHSKPSNMHNHYQRHPSPPPNGQGLMQDIQDGIQIINGIQQILPLRR